MEGRTRQSPVVWAGDVVAHHLPDPVVAGLSYPGAAPWNEAVLAVVDPAQSLQRPNEPSSLPVFSPLDRQALQDGRERCHRYGIARMQ